MKSVVIYDSTYGNTERIARAIASALGSSGEVLVSRVGDAASDQIRGAGFVFIGSPTQGFRPTPAVKTFIEGLSKEVLKGVKVAVFDTRITGHEAGLAGRFVARLGGYAASHMGDAIEKQGGNLVAPPQGFAVNDREGPLAGGELERAVDWAKGIAEAG